MVPLVYPDITSVKILHSGREVHVKSSRLISPGEQSVPVHEVDLDGECEFGETVILKENRQSVFSNLTEMEFYEKLRDIQGIPRVLKARWCCDGRTIDDGIILEYAGRPVDFSGMKPDDPVILKLRKLLGEISKKGVIHFDDNPQNFLIRDNKVFIVDFGQSCEPEDVDNIPALTVNASTLATTLRKAQIEVPDINFKILKECEEWLLYYTY